MPDDGAFSIFGINVPSLFKKNPDGTWSLAVGNVCNGTKRGLSGTATTGAQLMIGANQKRQVLYICNNGSVTLYVGPQGQVDSTHGIPIAAGSYIVDIASYDAWYVAAASGTCVWTIVEIA